MVKNPPTKAERKDVNKDFAIQSFHCDLQMPSITL